MIPKKELLILHALRKNARKNLATISRETGIPITSVFEKVHKLQKTMIRKNTCFIDFSRLGHPLAVHFIIKVNNTPGFESFVIKNKNTNNVFRLNGGDFFIEALFRSMNNVQYFIEQVERFNVKELNTFHVLDELRKEQFLAKEEHLEMIYSNG